MLKLWENELLRTLYSPNENVGGKYRKNDPQHYGGKSQTVYILSDNPSLKKLHKFWHWKLAPQTRYSEILDIFYHNFI